MCILGRSDFPAYFDCAADKVAARLVSRRNVQQQQGNAGKENVGARGPSVMNATFIFAGLLLNRTPSAVCPLPALFAPCAPFCGVRVGCPVGR